MSDQARGETGSCRPGSPGMEARCASPESLNFQKRSLSRICVATDMPRGPPERAAREEPSKAAARGGWQGPGHRPRGAEDGEAPDGVPVAQASTG